MMSKYGHSMLAEAISDKITPHNDLKMKQWFNVMFQL